MSKVLDVVLSGLPPSTNKLYTRTRGGGQRVSDAATAWHDQVVYGTRQALHDTGFALAPRTPWRLTVEVWVPRWNRDLDNMLKHTIDALCATLGIDDRYLVQLIALRYVGDPAMRLCIAYGE